MFPDLLPHGGRRGSWMVFVDGENLAIQGKYFAKKGRLDLHVGAWHEPDVFLWLPDKSPVTVVHSLVGATLPTVHRSYYYTSCKGGERERRGVRRRIRDAGLEPKVFPRTKKQDSKGVDIAMARDVLVHAFDKNYDSCLLIAGDGDYIPLVEEVKRRGRQVVVSFFERSLNEDLRIEADRFVPLEELFVDAWKDYLYPRIRGSVMHCRNGVINVGLFGRRQADGTVDQSIHRVVFQKDMITVEHISKPGLGEVSVAGDLDGLLRGVLGGLKSDDAAWLWSQLEPES